LNAPPSPGAPRVATGLRHGAERLASALPPLLAAAEHLVASIMLGEHGRRRAGMGDEFWQYRAANPGDGARSIDWRRSARSDAHFVREREWQAAQTVVLWVDDGRSMAFSGARDRPPKSHRARLIALALAVLLIRAGERVGLSGDALPPSSGQVQLTRLAQILATEGEADYGRPDTTDIAPHARAVFLSDFLGDPAPVEAAVTQAADRGVRGALMQVLDPVEEAFPFDGRTIFESMGGGLRHETLKAGDLRDRYLDRLAERKHRLAQLARVTGWHFSCHHSGDAPLGGLMWLYHALERGR
jgi:uncharacterized protein (DUF58 family)